MGGIAGQDRVVVKQRSGGDASSNDERRVSEDLFIHGGEMKVTDDRLPQPSWNPIRIRPGPQGNLRIQ
jgi:hypothetical protein